MIYRLAACVLCVLLATFLACDREKPGNDAWSIDFEAFMKRASAAFEIEEHPQRVAAIEALMAEVEPGIPTSRRARHCTLQLLDALMGAHVSAELGEQAFEVEQKWERTARAFLKQDPADGQVAAFLIARLHRTSRQAEAWNLADEASGKVDLESMDALALEVTRVVDYLESQAQKENDTERGWRPRFLTFIDALKERVPADSPKRELRFTLVESEAKVLVRMGRFDAAESGIAELLRIDPGRASIVDLEDALHRGRRSKR